jgi:uncharacterized membrane protein
MIHVILYVRENCPECDQAQADLQSLQATVPHQVKVVQVEQERGSKEKIGDRLPLVEIGPFKLRHPFTRQDLQVMLTAARDRIEQMDRVEIAVYERTVGANDQMPASDRITRFLAYHYLALVNVLLLIYVGLPFLAPVLLKVGAQGPANIIYAIYKPMCHQLAYRSWFLFGEQPYYPRGLSGIAGVQTYEQVTGLDAADLLAGRNFNGNEVVGFKVALCQRDTAIYFFMLLFGVFFGLSGRRLRSLPWFVWILVGMIPIGLDGFSQLPSLAQGLPDWLPFRESSPLLRTLTGGLFGWMTAWYLFPMLQETAVETRKIFEHRVAVGKKIAAQKNLNE